MAFLRSALQKIKKAFELRYIGRNKEDTDTWLGNIIVLIPKTKVIDRLEGQTRGICVQSVLAKWYCGCLTILLQIEMRSVERRDKSWANIHTFGFEEGRSATEISTASDSRRRQRESGSQNLGLLLVLWM